MILRKPRSIGTLALALVAVFFCLSGSVQADEETKAPEASPLPEKLQILAKAKRLEELRPRGESETTQALKDFLAQKDRADKANQDALVWMKEHASPAGRVYATMVLATITRQSVPKALLELAGRDGSTNVEVLSAGSSCHFSVSDIAVDQSSPAPILKLLPKLP